ncbi:MAG: hypothetical protein KDB26_01215 [Microthrixaceae bacterium]|nr:hypothetical protein [Microthrixaceae bacterium]
MVIFENRDGHPGYNQFDSVESAVSFVEDLRNNQGIDKFQIFELKEVKFELKTYYRVQLQALNPGAPSKPAAGQQAPAAQPAAAAQPAPKPAAETAAPAPAAPPQAAPPKAEPTPAAAAPTPQSGAAAPVPPADQPSEDDQPARRGLFGR